MSANLDKGLDEIISDKGSSAVPRRGHAAKKTDKKSGTARGFKKAGAGTSSKTLSKAIAAAASARGTKSQPKALVANPLEAARRAVVSHLPADVSADDARSFFASRVGRIRQVTGGFRQDGRPSGEFTFTFDAPGKALELMNKFNGQPIDGGKSKLAVQILLDANTAQAPRPLSERIGKLSQTPTVGAAAGAAGDKKKRRNANNTTRKRAGDAPKPAAKATKAEPVKAARAKAKKNGRAAQPRKVRTAADLDAEMSDYFAAADKNEISV